MFKKRHLYDLNQEICFNHIQIVSNKYQGYVTFQNTALTWLLYSLVCQCFHWQCCLPWTLSLLRIRIESKSLTFLFTVTKFSAIYQILFFELNIEIIVPIFFGFSLAYSTSSLFETYWFSIRHLVTGYWNLSMGWNAEIS